MVWPTLGSRTAKEQKRTAMLADSTRAHQVLLRQGRAHSRPTSRSNLETTKPGRPRAKWIDQLRRDNIPTGNERMDAEIIINHTVNLFCELQSAFW